MDKMASIRAQCPNVMKVVNITGRGGHGGWSISLKELEELGRQWDAEHEGAYLAGIEEVESPYLATLIYTSGTTGDPKGWSSARLLGVRSRGDGHSGSATPADKQFLWLPLSHSFGKVLEALTIRIGVPTAIDGRLDRIVANLGEVRPTFVAAVPRIFEKVFNKVVADAKGSKLKFRVFKWALDNGRTVSQLKQRVSSPRACLHSSTRWPISWSSPSSRQSSVGGCGSSSRARRPCRARLPIFPALPTFSFSRATA